MYYQYFEDPPIGSLGVLVLCESGMAWLGAGSTLGYPGTEIQMAQKSVSAYR